MADRGREGGQVPPMDRGPIGHPMGQAMSHGGPMSHAGPMVGQPAGGASALFWILCLLTGLAVGVGAYWLVLELGK